MSVQYFRCYHFCHRMLSPMQTGIQSAHAQMELFVKYRKQRISQKRDLYKWATDDKTMICLNGGGSNELRDIFTMFDRPDNSLAWSAFHEDEDSLDGVMTNIAIIVPYEIYNASEEMRNTPDFSSTLLYFPKMKDGFKRQLVDLLRTSRLAS